MNKTSDRREKNNGSVRELQDEFLRELKLLRTQAREVCENFMLRREGNIETIISSIPLVNRKKLKELLPSWLREIHHLKLKPHKGRLKDLKEIDRIIANLQDIVIDASGKASRHKSIKRNAHKTEPAQAPAIE